VNFDHPVVPKTLDAADRQLAMGRPRKTLRELVWDGTFRARRHASLLAGEPMDERPDLADLQWLYSAAEDDFVARAIAVRFERIVRDPFTHALKGVDAENAGDGVVNYDSVPLR
jgi:hypothetical protein